MHAPHITPWKIQDELQESCKQQQWKRQDWARYKLEQEVILGGKKSGTLII